MMMMKCTYLLTDLLTYRNACVPSQVGGAIPSGSRSDAPVGGGRYRCGEQADRPAGRGDWVVWMGGRQLGRDYTANAPLANPRRRQELRPAVTPSA